MTNAMLPHSSKEKVPRLSDHSLLLAAGAVLLGSVALSAILVPRGLVINEGISLYGIYARTIIPYASGLFTVAATLALIAHRSTEPYRKLLLYSIAALAAIIVFVPYSLSPAFNIIHISIGATLYTLALAFALLTSKERLAHQDKKPKALLLLTLSVMILAWLLSAWWIFHTTGHLIFAQIIFLLAFLANASQSLASTDTEIH